MTRADRHLGQLVIDQRLLGFRGMLEHDACQIGLFVDGQGLHHPKQREGRSHPLAA